VRNDDGILAPWDGAEITRALARQGSLWREVRAVAETRSTNADLLAAAGAGAPEGVVLVADAQTGGRGRMGRRWISPPRAGLTVSVLLRPIGVPAVLLGWLPLLTGVAAASAVRAVSAVEPRLKWPNDVLVRGAKLGGILAERSGSAVVVGIGINVSQHRSELPGSTATSLLLEAPGGTGADLREPLLVAMLDGLARRYLAWRDQASPGDADACGLRGEYTCWCATLGREVTVTLPGGQVIAGAAVGVDPAGRLEVRTSGRVVPVSAGDVVHVR
jgi:BirA family transcriptional regulator, biotin operon repressor / biotin---[acetyl-CoA-carboxylase] ligase